MSRRALKEDTRTEYTKFDGGLDMVTPHISIPPGCVLSAVNYEQSINGGYRRINGYERFDGRTSPSSASYYLIKCTLIGTVAVGNTITGVTSGATGYVLQVNGTTEIVITALTGTFVLGESIQVSGITVGTTTAGSAQGQGAALTLTLHNSYQNLAATYYRNLIGVVPGSGSILGIWTYNDIVYAYRNNAGGTAANMYKSSSSGWMQISLGYQIAFSAGTTQISDGQTVVGATSGATAVVARSCMRTGSWTAGSPSTGILVFASIAGTFQNGEGLKVGATTCATSSSTATAITLPAGGRYEFYNFNFSGTSNNYRMYGCNGVGTAFEFDGTTFVPIVTGMPTDTPSFIACHVNCLFLAFGGSIQQSGIGTPYVWSVVLGASEIDLGDIITGMKPQTGDQTTQSMMITTRHQTWMLYGTSSANWQVVMYSNEAGGVPYTMQNLGLAYYMDDRGLVKLSTTLNYGNFEQAVVSRHIQPFIDANRGLITASTVLRNKNQYRLFYSNGLVLICTLNVKATSLGSSVPTYSFTTASMPNAVSCICSADNSAGIEQVFFGSTNGYVYQMDVGNSFDGSVITACLRTAFNHEKSPRIRKRYRKIVLEMTAEGQATISINYDLSYGSTDIYPAVAQTTNAYGVGGYWDEFYWNQFLWDAQIVTENELKIDGTGLNISITVLNNTIEPPHILQGAILHYTPRRLSR